MGEITVTVSEYLKEHVEFVNEHNENGACKYSSIPYKDGILRTFQWEDGARWQEITVPITEKKMVETHGIVVKANVKIWRTEYWSSESEKIKCFYEQD